LQDLLHGSVGGQAKCLLLLGIGGFEGRLLELLEFGHGELRPDGRNVLAFHGNGLPLGVLELLCLLLGDLPLPQAIFGRSTQLRSLESGRRLEFAANGLHEISGRVLEACSLMLQSKTAVWRDTIPPAQVAIRSVACCALTPRCRS